MTISLPHSISEKSNRPINHLINNLKTLLLIFIIFCFACMPVSKIYASKITPYIVSNDRGGYVHHRIIEIMNMEAQQTPVEIRGSVCYSTCTMYLVLTNICVEQDIVFGFHGPRTQAYELSQDRFDYFSRVMADYYPEPLKLWFIEKGRNRVNGLYKIHAEQIIDMGIPACSET